jgi:hypothetical protein
MMAKLVTARMRLDVTDCGEGLPLALDVRTEADGALCLMSLSSRGRKWVLSTMLATSANDARDTR